VEQDGKSYALPAVSQPARRFAVERHAAPANATFAVGTQSAKGLHDGKARIVVSAVVERFARINRFENAGCGLMTVPPRVAADGAQHYINQGGAEMVVFTPAGRGQKPASRWATDFQELSVADHPGQFFSLFAFELGPSVDTRCR